MGLKTIERLGDLLSLFTPTRTEWMLADIARALGLPRSTAHGLLVSVAATGLLEAVGQGRYRLGPRIAELNAVRVQRQDIREAATEVLQRLTGDTWETSNLGVLVGSAAIYLDSVPGRHHVSVTGAHPGTRLAANRTAIGKILLSYNTPAQISLPRAEAAGVLAGTSANAGLLPKEAETIRREEIAYDLGDVSPEIRCIAVPVRDGDGTVVAALSISTTATRFTRHHERLTDRLRTAASALSARLQPPPA
ncbi:IclR family transcriptional regulator [Streptomyces sp. NPDC050625]|uniref:IclR family transcriptional regulator n=1 Tax=Streptomyces sp. NPDC050625 TaxID=3154629 RepID=UPI003434982D